MPRKPNKAQNPTESKISVSGMVLVREWRNLEALRMERLYEDDNGQHFLWTANYDKVDPNAPVTNETVKSLALGEMVKWYSATEEVGKPNL